MGSIKSSILSEEDVMHFKSPCEILIKNKNNDSLEQYIASHVTAK